MEKKRSISKTLRNVKNTSTSKKSNKTLEEFNFVIKKSLSLTSAERLPDMPSNKSISIYAWNINGIRAMMNKGHLQKFMMYEQPDILCLGETRIDDKTLKEIDYKNLFSDYYSSYWSCSKVKKGYSGVAIFTKYKPLDVIYGMNNMEDEEGRILTLEFPDFFITSVYVPNSGNQRLHYRTNQWDLDFHKFIHTLRDRKDVIVCGDLNVAHQEIDIHNPKTNEGCACFTIEERNNFTDLLNAGYIDTFRHLNPKDVKYSYFSTVGCMKKNKGWRLDYFVVNKEAIDRVEKSEILMNYFGSDHVPIKLTWRLGDNKYKV